MSYFLSSQLVNIFERDQSLKRFDMERFSRILTSKFKLAIVIAIIFAAIITASKSNAEIIIDEGNEIYFYTDNSTSVESARLECEQFISFVSAESTVKDLWKSASSTNSPSEGDCLRSSSSDSQGSWYTSWFYDYPWTQGHTNSYISEFWYNKCQSPSIFNVSTGDCGNDQQKGTPPLMACQGNPINISIGNKFQSESDFQASGTSALSFSRTYNSLDGIWRHGYSTFLRLAIGKLSLVRADGRETFYTVTDTATIPDATERGSLVKNSDGTWVYTSDTNETFVFDSTGRMTNWSSLDGKTLQFAYANSQVTVTDQLGKTLTYTEDAQHQPLTLTAPGTQITYTYDAYQRLSKLTKAIGTQTQQRQFLYENTLNRSLLTGIIDERGIRYATWTYDDQGRAISSEHSGGAEHISVTYNSDGTSTVTNELGKSTIYSFVTIDGVKRVTSINGEPSPNCPASNSTYTYNPAGQVLTKTDAKGIITQYTYNDRGLETQRIEGSGSAQPRTTTTEWDPSRFLRTKVAGPTHTTVYTYDAQGRQLTQVTTPNSSQ